MRYLNETDYSYGNQYQVHITLRTLGRSPGQRSRSRSASDGHIWWISWQLLNYWSDFNQSGHKYFPRMGHELIKFSRSWIQRSTTFSGFCILID